MNVRVWIETLASQMRLRYVKRTPASLPESYSAAFFLARPLRRRVRDVTIMVGDDLHGMHHWLESKRLGIFVDAAAGDGVRIGELSSPTYSDHYFGAQDSGFRVDVPRDHPK
jgi:hypothetical protein